MKQKIVATGSMDKNMIQKLTRIMYGEHQWRYYRDYA